MEEKIVTSKKFTLNWRDIGQSLLLAVGTDVLVVVQQTIESGNLNFDWKHIAYIAIGSTVTYLTRNFLREAKTVTLNK